MTQFSKKALLNLVVAGVLGLSVSACSNFLYRIDVPQGNFLEQKDINKLRIKMTKEQVLFVLGHPVAENSFEDNIWHYYYSLKGGRGENFLKQLVLTFKDGHLTTMSGDFDVPKDFNTPLDQ